MINIEWNHVNKNLYCNSIFTKKVFRFNFRDKQPLKYIKELIK